MTPEQSAILDNFCWGNPNLLARLGSPASALLHEVLQKVQIVFQGTADECRAKKELMKGYLDIGGEALGGIF